MADKDKTQNRSLSCRSTFRPLENSNASIKPGQIYGPISTPSYVTCNSLEPVDYRVLLNTSGSAEHSLSPDFIYGLSGKILLLNTPAPPILNYFIDLVCKICRVADQVDDSTDKTFTSGLGLVVSVQSDEAEDDELKTSKKADLSLVVSHTDWDPIARGLKSFNVKYIIPANPRLVNTHSMIRSGRDFFFDGYLAGWDLKQRLAIIKVLAVSPVMTSNSSLGSKSTLSSPQASPMNKGRKFVTFDEPDLSFGSSPLTMSTTASNLNPASIDQGQGTSRSVIDYQELDSPDESPLANIPSGKGKGRANPSVTSPKKKRGPPPV